jgi:hypothetical protein
MFPLVGQLSNFVAFGVRLLVRLPGLTVMVNGDVDGGAPSDLSAGGQRLSKRSEGCGVGAAGAADPPGVARRATAQDRHAGGDERHSVFAAQRWPLPSGGLPGHRSPTHQTAGLHRTMAKVCKPDCEGTIAGTRGNGEDAPIPDLPALTPERGGSTRSGHSSASLDNLTSAGED